MSSVCMPASNEIYFGLVPLTVTVTTRGNRSYKNPLNKAPLRTVTGRGNDPSHSFAGSSTYKFSLATLVGP